MKVEPTGKLLKDFQNWRNSFFNYCDSKQLSLNTKRNYEKALEQFEEFLRGYDDEISFKQINKPLLELYLVYLQKRYSPSTISVYFTILKSFFLYISEENEDQQDFMRMFRKLRIKKHKKIPPSLTREEVDRLIEYTASMARADKNRIHVRDALAIKLLSLTGMRASSLLNLKFKDFTLRKYNGKDIYEILIVQKGNKENRVYVEAGKIKWEIDALKSYSKEKNGYVFLSSTGKLLNRINLYHRIAYLFDKIGIKKRGVHIFRHTFVKLKREEGVDLSIIKTLLGHSSVTTTINIYGAVREDEKIKASLDFS